MPPAATINKSRDRRTLLALFLFALLIRAGAALQTAAIFNDGPAFVKLAQWIAEGEWAQALAHHYHPLYPMLTALLSFVVGDVELAAIFVSAISGSVAVVVLHGFLRRAFDPTVGWIGALLLALHPYAAEFSADVQSEGLYFALFLACIGWLWRGVEEGHARFAAAAGTCAGLAYLVRPEGLGLLAVGGGFVVMRLLQRRWAPLQAARWSAALLVCAMVVSGPYVFYLHELTGEWSLTQKKSISQLIESDAHRAEMSPATSPVKPIPKAVSKRVSKPASALPLPRGASLGPAALFELALPAARIGVLPARTENGSRVAAALGRLLLVGAAAFHPLLLVLLALGLYLARGRPDDRGLLLAGVAGIYAAVLFLLALNVGYLDRRHVLAPLLPLLGYAALAVPIVGGWLLRAWPRMADAPRNASIWACLAIVVVVTVPKTWAPHREEQLANRNAAEWLAMREDLTGPVAAEKYRTAYYAREDFVFMGYSRASMDPKRLWRLGARFVIVDDTEMPEFPRMQGALEGSGQSDSEESSKLRELHRTEAAGRTAYVYELTQ